MVLMSTEKPLKNKQNRTQRVDINVLKIKASRNSKAKSLKKI